MTWKAPASGMISSSRLTSCTLPSVTRINVGMLPRRSSSVCSLIAAFRRRNRAHGNSARHRSMVVESRAYRLCSRSTPIDSRAYSPRAVAISRWAKSAKILQSRDSLTSAIAAIVQFARNSRRAGRLQIEIHHVVDVGKVAGLLAVSEYCRGAPLHHGFDEQRQHTRILTGGILARAEDVEVAQ